MGQGGSRGDRGSYGPVVSRLRGYLLAAGLAIGAVLVAFALIWFDASRLVVRLAILAFACVVGAT